MAFTANSTIGDILKEKPSAKEVLEKHAGQTVNPSMLAMAMGMTLQQIAGFIGWNPEKIQALVDELNAL